MERTILHCDMNSFFASVELLEHPSLRHKPVAVAGDPQSRHGIILAKNEAAKRFHIQTAETIWQAQKKCPELILLPAHHEKYHDYCDKVNQIYLSYTDLVEPFSVDESFLDITGSLHLLGGDGKAVADEIRARVHRELGLTVSVGVSFNKVFAKLGSDYQKPDATTVISRENFREIVWPLPVSDLLFVGKACQHTLGEYGIYTIGQLAAFGREALVTILGKQGATLYEYANGLECAPVRAYGDREPPKSVGNGLTFQRNLVGREELYSALTLLSDNVAARLRKLGRKCAGVQLQIRDPNFKTISRQTLLSTPTWLARELADHAMALLAESWNLSAPVRMLTVTAIHLVDPKAAGEQLSLMPDADPQKREKLERLERTMDAIRGKYGSDAITRACARKKDGRGEKSEGES